MIKRNAHIFNTQVALQEYLDQMGDDETLAQYTVNDGTHYIITERKMSDDKHKKFKIIELINKIAKCKADYESKIKACEGIIHNHNVALNYEAANLYMQRREDLIEEYNEEQRKLTKMLDKLNQL